MLPWRGTTPGSRLHCSWRCRKMERLASLKGCRCIYLPSAFVSILTVLLAIVQKSAGLNPNYVPTWRCSSTSPIYYGFGGVYSNVIAYTYCNSVVHSSFELPKRAAFETTCLSQYSKDIALGDSAAEFATDGGGCYPNATGVCPSNLYVICKPPDMTYTNHPQCPLISIPNGTVEYPSGRQFPSYVRYTCNAGFKRASNVRHRQCQPTGAWLGNAFSCEVDGTSTDGVAMSSVQTTMTPSVLPSTVTTFTAQEDAITAGDAPSFQPRKQTTETLPNPATSASQLSSGSCSSVPTIANGHLQINNSMVGSTAILVCNDGYALTGEGSATCLASGSWTLPKGRCDSTSPSSTASSTVSVVLLALLLVLGLSFITVLLILFWRRKQQQQQKTRRRPHRNLRGLLGSDRNHRPLPPPPAEVLTMNPAYDSANASNAGADRENPTYDYPDFRLYEVEEGDGTYDHAAINASDFMVLY